MCSVTCFVFHWFWWPLTMVVTLLQRWTWNKGVSDTYAWLRWCCFAIFLCIRNIYIYLLETSGFRVLFAWYVITGFTGICWSPYFFLRFCAQVQCHNAFGGKRIVNQTYSTWGNADELMNWLFTGSCNHALIGHVHWNRVQCWLTFCLCRCS